MGKSKLFWERHSPIPEPSQSERTPRPHNPYRPVAEVECRPTPTQLTIDIGLQQERYTMARSGFRIYIKGRLC